MLLRKISTALDLALTYPLFLFSLLIPRDPKLWVFIGWHRGPEMETFADNTKYLFLYASKRNVRCVWLAKDEKLARVLRERGYESYAQGSLRGIMTSLRAGTYIIDAYLLRENFRLVGRAKLVQLLHGKGFKKEGYGKPQFKTADLICVPSREVAHMLPRSFAASASIAVTGYPRTDVFVEEIANADVGVDVETRQKLSALVAEMPQPRTILYAPTYRRGQSQLDFSKMLPAHVLDPWLRKNNFHLFVSLHPKYRHEARGAGSERIHYIRESDIYPLLSSFDLLVGDYSSLFADYLLLDRPLVFYPFDREAYEAREGFNVDYDAMTPGPKCMDIQSLMQAIEEQLRTDSYAKERARVRAIYHAFPAGGASGRSFEAIQDLETARAKSAS